MAYSPQKLTTDHWPLTTDTTVICSDCGLQSGETSYRLVDPIAYFNDYVLQLEETGYG